MTANLDGIAIANLQEALSHHTRMAIQDNWQVGTGATTTTIPVTLRNPNGTAIDITGAVATDMQGARVEFTSGLNIGVSRLVNSAANDGTLTLDTALPYSPASGDLFVVFQDIHVAVTVASPENIAQVGSVSQTGADWTPLFQAIPTVDGWSAQNVAVTSSSGGSVTGATFTAPRPGTHELAVMLQTPVIADPTAGLTLAQSAGASAFTATEVVYLTYWQVNANGNTKPAPVESITISTAGNVITTSVTLDPAATAIGLAVDTASTPLELAQIAADGTITYSGSATSGLSVTVNGSTLDLTISAIQSGGASEPTANTTAAPQTVSLTITPSGGSAATATLNGGATLTPGDWYTFQHPLPNGAEAALSVGGAGTVSTFSTFKSS